MNSISQINRVLESYFALNKSVSILPAKDLMPYFIKAGIFPKDEKNGLPIRKILRKLDAAKQLALIPYVVADRKAVNTNWFLSNTKKLTLVPAREKTAVSEVKAIISKTTSRKDSDEHYVIDICDEILGMVGSRQHKFDFLSGDPGKTGSRARLPVDVYYEDLQLVIEFNEQQHTKANKHFDKPHKVTVSDVHRGEQRKIYDQRKRTVLPHHGIKVVTISYDLFKCLNNGKIVRNRIEDMKLLKMQLQEFKGNK